MILSVVVLDISGGLKQVAPQSRNVIVYTCCYFSGYTALYSLLMALPSGNAVMLYSGMVIRRKGQPFP